MSDTMTSKGSICSPADSPAKILASQEGKMESGTETDPACGENSHGLLGTFDLDSYSLRTSQDCLYQEQCEEFLETFPRSGTMRNGKVYRRPPLVPLTYETECGYLPTPDRSMGMTRGGITILADATTCFRKERGESRPSGAKIGSSLRWCPEYIRESLRTGGFINPEWIGVLMGFPEKWLTDETDSSETPSCHKSPSGSDGE